MRLPARFSLHPESDIVLAMLSERISAIVTSFSQNVDSVLELMKFDQLVLEVAIRHVEALHERLTRLHEFDNPRFDVAHTLQMLRGIRRNDSLKPHYREMLNQCNVLLVSYFSGAVGDIFASASLTLLEPGVVQRC